MKYFVFILLTLLGCRPGSPKDFRLEGEAKCRELVALLGKVETREDLLRSEPTLKKKFYEMTELILLAEKYLKVHPLVESHIPNRYSKELESELKRVSQIVGGKEILEGIQKEPLIYLHRNGPQKAPSAP